MGWPTDYSQLIGQDSCHCIHSHCLTPDRTPLLVMEKPKLCVANSGLLCSFDLNFPVREIKYHGRGQVRTDLDVVSVEKNGTTALYHIIVAYLEVTEF